MDDGGQQYSGLRQRGGRAPLLRVNQWSNELDRGAGSAGRWLTAGRRLVPDYVVIGAAKCGTTSLQAYLSTHPQIRPALTKEVHYYDHNSQLGQRWYRAHFPFAEKGRGWITGEATPYYLSHPSVPERMASIAPKTKLIVMMRDPADRALSQYQMAKNEYGVEPLSFEDALDAEEERLAGELEKLRDDPRYFSFEHIFHGYKERGHYKDQLTQWMSMFPRDQFLFIKSERFYKQTGDVYREVLDFLELDEVLPDSFRAENARSYDRMSPDTREKLNAYFAERNAGLEQLVGWEGPGTVDVSSGLRL